MLPLRLQPAYVGPALALLGLGVLWLGLGLRRYRRTRVAPDWPTTEGEVIGTGLVPPAFGGSQYSRAPGLIPGVRYRYRVGGAEYEQWYEDVRVDPDDPEFFAKLEARFPIGRRLAVRYHPERPAVAVAVGDWPWRGYGQMLLGAFSLAVGVVLSRHALGL